MIRCFQDSDFRLNMLGRKFCVVNSLILASLVCLQLKPACGQSEPVGDAGTATEVVDEVLMAAIAARDDNAKRLQTAVGSGRVSFEIHEAGASAPVTVMDSDLQVFYDAPRFRLHLAHDIRLTEAMKPQGVEEEDFQKWIPAEVIEQVVIYDGEKVYSVEYLREEECRGSIMFGFSKLAVLRGAGFPFENPVEMWEQALRIEELDRKRLSITPFGDGGFVGLLSKNTYRVKFFFFNRFGYDLRRVSSYRVGENQPFRDYLLSWEESNGVHFVQRFSNIVTSAHGDTASAQQTVRRLTVEFDTFDANVEIKPQVFELSSIEIPPGTRFIDKRSSVEGGPKQLVYRESKLQAVLDD